MASPLLLAAVLLLASGASAGPSIFEWLSGIQYVPPAGWIVTSDPACQHCTTGQGRNFFGFLAPLPCCPPLVLPPTTPGTCPKCGVERSQRIVGGTEATPGMYPWIAAFAAGGEVGGCAATLVSSDWAVTAAHCVFYSNSTPVLQSQMTLILGEHTIITPNDEFDANRKEVALALDPIYHPNYNHLASIDYDIALLKLAESVDLGVHTPACLPAPTDFFTDGTTKASVYGWGRTDHCIPTLAPTLREAEVTITTNAACSAVSTTYKLCNGTSVPASGAGLITERMLCAVSAGQVGCQADRGGPITVECQGSCQGDSGGPLTVESSGQHTLAGVVSWGAPGQCGSPGLPTVYANVVNLRNWVETTIAANGGLGTVCDG